MFSQISKEPELDVYLEIFGILQFRLFPVFSKRLGETQIEVI